MDDGTGDDGFTVDPAIGSEDWREDLTTIGRDLIGTLRTTLASLSYIAGQFRPEDAVEFGELARGVEDALALREAFHLKYVTLLRTPGGRKAVGTANTTAHLIDHLGLSRTEAHGRTQASICLGDVEPEPYDGDFRDEAAEARLIVQREDNRVAALTKAESGAVTCDKLRILRLALHDLKPGGCYSAEDIKAIVLDRIEDLSAEEVRQEARALVEESNESLGPDPFEDLRGRHLTLSDRKNKSGGYNLSASVPADTAALLRKYLNTHALKGAGIELPDGLEDKRPMPQRNADAFARMVTRAVHGGDGSGTGDVVKHNTGNAALVVTFSGDGWTRRMADCGGVAGLVGRTNVGVPLTLAQCLRAGMVGSWFAALFDKDDPDAEAMPLHLGRLKRSASAAQRIALQVVDGCCQHPGCGRPIDECDIHHIVSFLAGGRTDIENLVPLCRHHHTINDDTHARPDRGHMRPRTPGTGWRSGRAGPLLRVLDDDPSAAEAHYTNHDQSLHPERRHPGPPGWRTVAFNSTPAARAAAGYSHQPSREVPEDVAAPPPEPGPGVIRLLIDLDDPDLGYYWSGGKMPGGPEDDGGRGA